MEAHNSAHNSTTRKKTTDQCNQINQHLFTALHVIRSTENQNFPLRELKRILCSLVTCSEVSLAYLTDDSKWGSWISNTDAWTTKPVQFPCTYVNMRLFTPLEMLNNGKNGQQMDIMGGRRSTSFT